MLFDFQLVSIVGREELEKQRAHERYMRLQEQGKTEQARKDLGMCLHFIFSCICPFLLPFFFVCVCVQSWNYVREMILMIRILNHEIDIVWWPI